MNHWLNTVDEHSIHSPFFFDFYTKIIMPKDAPTGVDEIEKIRAKLIASKEEITIHDLGAKSAHFNSSKRSLSQIAATSLSSERMAQLLYRTTDYLDARQIVELGTSMGITSLYLAKKEHATIYTFEGNTSMINIALTNFEFFEQKNIHLIEGNIDDTLPKFLQTPRKINLVFMDANHRYEATLNYFNLLTKRMADEGVMIIDDIYHSAEMGRAWHQLKNHELVYGSIDLFRCGILFFDPTLNKQHYVCTV